MIVTDKQQDVVMEKAPELVDEPAHAPISVGAILKHTRDQQNLSIPDVAKQLRLSIAQVEWLEADAYDRLPGLVFVRGFLRNYARLLGLNGDELLSHLVLEQNPVLSSIVVERARPITLPFYRKWVALLPYFFGLLLCIAVVLVYELFIIAPDEDDSQEQTEVAQNMPDASPTVSKLDVANTPVSTVGPKLEQQKPADQQLANGTVAPSSAASNMPPVAVEVGKISIKFIASSWVDVRDRDDRVIYSQLNQAGTERVVEGIPPLRIVVGNAAGVRLAYNGKPFDMAPFTNIDVARFTLE